MTLRIAKSSDEACTTLKLSGRVRARQIEELRGQMDAGTRGIILDLQEVTLVDVEVVRFLGSCEAEGTKLAHCPRYIREWIFREQAVDEGDQARRRT